MKSLKFSKYLILPYSYNSYFNISSGISPGVVSSFNFSLNVAEKYPSVSITAVSNSKDQITFIQNEAKRRSLFNIKALKMDVNNLDLDNKFDILEHTEHGIVTQLSQHSNVINKKIKSNAKCIS